MQSQRALPANDAARPGRRAAGLTRRTAGPITIAAASACGTDTQRMVACAGAIGATRSAAILRIGDAGAVAEMIVGVAAGQLARSVGRIAGTGPVRKGGRAVQ